MQVLVAPDKFKGTLDASAAAAAIAEGVRRSLPSAEVLEVPIADGGEGTLDVLLRATSGRVERITVADPLGRLIETRWAAFGSTAVVEMAAASGLALIPPQERNALGASSRGTGETIAAALKECNKVVVTVGGSASTDAGVGAASALGWRFLDAEGDPLPDGGGALGHLEALTRPHPLNASIVGACDVTNPLLGTDGCARVFSPQKGASSAEVRILDAGLVRVAEVVQRSLALDIGYIPMGGAGGGMGAGLVAFLGAGLVSGFDLVAEWIGLAEHLDRADLVLTGEGGLDATSLEGKATGSVAHLAADRGIPCFAIAGTIELPGPTSPFADMLSLTAEFGLDASLHETTRVLSDAAERLAGKT